MTMASPRNKEEKPWGWQPRSQGLGCGGHDPEVSQTWSYLGSRLHLPPYFPLQEAYPGPSPASWAE